MLGVAVDCLIVGVAVDCLSVGVAVGCLRVGVAVDYLRGAPFPFLASYKPLTITAHTFP